MEILFPAAIGLVGFLIMFRIIPVRNWMKYVAGIALIFMFFPILRSAGNDLLKRNWPWWVYPVGILSAFVIIRIFLDTILPWRRK